MVLAASFQNTVVWVGAQTTNTIKTSERTCGLAVKHQRAGYRRIWVQQPGWRSPKGRNLTSFVGVCFFCIAVMLATLAGCAADRGTIGAQLGQRDDGHLFIREAPSGLAAARAGLKPGDEITLINGRDVRSFDEKGLHNLLSGDVGDPVKLTVLRGEQVLHVTLQRTPAPRPHKPEK